MGPFAELWHTVSTKWGNRTARRTTDDFNQRLRFLGGVKQNVARLEWCRALIFQLLVYVGTARQSKCANERCEMKRA